MASTLPVLDERRLRKALTEQGFKLKKTTDGFRVLAPDGKGTSSFHPSIFTSDWNRGWLNQMAQLRRIGFDPSKVEVESTNGEAKEWQRQREAIDTKIAEDHAAAEAKRKEEEARTEAEAARTEADAARAGLVESLFPAVRELYDAIAANPGKRPRDYAEDLHLDSSTISSRGTRLLEVGLIEATGQTKARRWHLAGQAPAIAALDAVHDAVKKATPAAATKSGKPAAGPVRVREIEPADPVIRFKRLGQRAARAQQELNEKVAQVNEIVTEMMEAYEAVYGELVSVRDKKNKLEQILGRAVDAL